MSKRTADAELPDWERLLSAAARLQKIVPGAVLVGGTAAAIHAGHRLSMDDDHVVVDLRERFSAILSDLEAAAGWVTARVSQPVLILGSLDGIETGVRQLIRKAPLETEEVERFGVRLTVPTGAEMLRIKGVLILRRNAARDYVDFAALGDGMGQAAAAAALRRFDDLYPQSNGESSLQQLAAQLASPLPYDLEQTDLSEYRHLESRWHDWKDVASACRRIAVNAFDRICEEGAGP